jgi:hypothetical protein
MSCPQNGATALDAAYRSGNDDVVYLLSTLSEAIKRGEYPLIARIMAWPKVDVNECVRSAPALHTMCALRM